MALSNTLRKVIHAGNASATVFPYTFPIPEVSQISVIYTDAAGAETTLSPSLYTVTGIGTLTGGSVIYPLIGSAIATGTLLTIVRTVAYTQDTVLINQGGYYPEVVEAALDKITMEIQQLAEITSRYNVDSISTPATEQSNLALIQALQVMNILTTRGDVLTRDATAYKRLALGTAGQFLGVSGSDLAWLTPSSFSGVRQTAQFGPVTSAGLASFLPATSLNLNLTSQNLSSTYPLVCTAANGNDGTAGSSTNRLGFSTANLTWTGLTLNKAAATPNYLYVTVNADGTLSTGQTVLAPIYQWGGVPATTSGQFTFNKSEMKGYMGNGVTAPQAYLVFVGEAATDATTVISTVAYAYNGRYESAFTATLPAAATKTSVSHNLGIAGAHARVIFENTSTEANFAVGEQLVLGESVLTFNGAIVLTPVVILTPKTVAFTGSTDAAPWVTINATTGASVALTSNKWQYKFVVSRGW